MNPDELAQEFQEKNYDYFLGLMLDKVPENIDKREGSIIYDAVAPAAMVMAQESLALANLIKQVYIKTAQGEFLDWRAYEHGTKRFEATQTEVRAIFQDADGKPIDNVAIGDKFASLGESPIFYTVTKINDDLSGEMVADEPGTEPNSYLGQVIPVTANDRVNWAEIEEITVPSRDAESDEHLRNRLLKADSWLAYGGNIADYVDMISRIKEVGAAQVYPTWNGPGTVKLVITDNNYQPASDTLVKKVKDEIDPEDKTALGYGLSPIDHRVTVVAPNRFNVDIKARITISSTANLDDVKAKIRKSLEEYFDGLRKTWSVINSATGRGYSLNIYRSKILSRIMMVEGVSNCTMPVLNGKEEDISLTFTNEVSQLPELGEVTLNG